MVVDSSIRFLLILLPEILTGLIPRTTDCSFEMTAKYGTPYFSNYINSDMEPSDVRSMCCRLRLDLRELRKKSGGFFGSGESTGSVGVVTINMPRIAYLAKDEADFYARLDHMMDIAAKILKDQAWCHHQTFK